MLEFVGAPAVVAVGRHCRRLLPLAAAAAAGGAAAGAAAAGAHAGVFGRGSCAKDAKVAAMEDSPSGIAVAVRLEVQ